MKSESGIDARLLKNGVCSMPGLHLDNDGNMPARTTPMDPDTMRLVASVVRKYPAVLGQEFFYWLRVVRSQVYAASIRSESFRLNETCVLVRVLGDALRVLAVGSTSQSM